VVGAGGGVALLYASRELEKLTADNFDQKVGIQIIQNALKVRKHRTVTQCTVVLYDVHF